MAHKHIMSKGNTGIEKGRMFQRKLDEIKNFLNAELLGAFIILLKEPTNFGPEVRSVLLFRIKFYWNTATAIPVHVLRG